jgi:hypothetical protein
MCGKKRSKKKEELNENRASTFYCSSSSTEIISLY